MAGEPVDAAALEAAGIRTVEVKFRDEVFTFPASMDEAPLSVLVAFDAQHFSDVVRGLLSDEDFEKLLAIPDIRIRDLGDLFNEYTRAIGQNPGE